MNYPQDISKIRHVQPQDPLSAQVTSEPTRAIELRLAGLEAAVLGSNSTATSTQLIIYNVNVNTTGENAVGLYSAVFFNPNSSLYESACATVTLVSGTFTTNPSALCVGIVIALRGSQADVMVGGAAMWGSDPGRAAIMNAMIVEGEAGFQAGTVYYLSDTYPGQLTQFPPSLKIQVLVASDSNYIVAPQYATPEAIQNVYTLPVGMSAVGGIRTVGQSQAQIVGFDALEQFDAVNNQWQLTSAGTNPTFINFGYMLADATVTTQPATPIYIRIEIDTGGNINIYSADTLANLFDTGVIYNQLTGGAALAAVNSGNFRTVRNYVVKNNQNQSLGTLSFNFTAYDVSLVRHIIFKFPDQFQGWKAVNSAVTPQATASISSLGAITSIKVVEGGYGFTTAPQVVITDSVGTGATATAVINEFGVITGVTVNTAGVGYVAPVISFANNAASVQPLNGGTGATATATVVGGVITAVTLTNGGANYYLDPIVLIKDPSGTGAGAQITTEVINGTVTSLTIVNGGSGYGSASLQIRNQFNRGYDSGVSTVIPVAAIVGQTPTTPPTLIPTFEPMRIARVDVLSSGISYNAGTTITISPNFGAVLHPVIDDLGHIIRVDVINPGSGFASVPTLTLANVLSGGVYGNGANLVAVLETSVTGVTVSAAGAGISDPATTVVGVPVLRIDATTGGTGYLTAPAVTIDAPDVAGIPVASGGVQATATALIGGTIQRVSILTPGAGYSQASPPTATLSGTGASTAALAVSVGTDGTIAAVEILNPGYGMSGVITVTLTGGTAPSTAATFQVFIEGNMAGVVVAAGIVNAGSNYNNTATIAVSGGSPTTPAVLTPIVSTDGNGSILGVTIVNPGAGYTSAPTLTVSAPGAGGIQAVLTAFLDGNAVVGFVITATGNGYVTPPKVTVAAPPYGTTAVGQSKLVGGTVRLNTALNGAGGNRMVQAAPLSTGNNLQITGYVNDFPDVSKPQNAAWYYNIKADPNLKALYPAVPIDKLTFAFNGVTLLVTIYNEAQSMLTNPDADIGVTRRTLLWSTFDNEGCPWDAAAQQFISDVAASGRDCIIPGTGPGTFTPAFWKLWSQVFKYEVQRNRAWVDLNKASRFYQTGRVESLSALPPLRLIDTVTGAQSNGDGLPMTGQLLLVNDSETSLFRGTGSQINLTNAGELQAIFQNNTGRLVALSSVLLTVVFQTNANNFSPDATFCAQITVGTEAGNYLDIVGSSTADVFSTRLFAVNQVKEIFPDADQPSPLIQPNQTVYLSVVQPAGAPIVVQMATAYIKGNVL